MASAGTRDGKGIFFVAHDGWAYPAGFLPLRLGNVREQGPVGTYRDHPLLRAVRAAEFGGRCGRCEFKDVCGGLALGPLLLAATLWPRIRPAPTSPHEAPPDGPAQAFER